MKHQPGDDDRQRNGRQRDEGRAEIHQEQKQNDEDEDRAVPQRLDYVVNAPVDELALLIQFRLDHDVGGQSAFQFVQSFDDGMRQRAGVGRGLLADGQHHGRMAVHRRVAAFDLRSLHDTGHVAQ